MIVDAILVAAGRGERFGAADAKQFQRFGGKPLWRWSYTALASAAQVRRTLIVIPAGANDQFSGVDAQQLVIGGATRSDSVRAGLTALAEQDAPPDAVLIHDAARPGLSQPLIARLVAALGETQAAAPALPVVDALKRQHSGGLETVSREGLYRVQTPQAFALPLIRAALAQTDAALVDDLAAVEALGAAVSLVQGEEANDKVTYRDDISRLEALMGLAPPMVRTGTGFDVHAFGPGDAVTLCGTSIPHSAGLAGHSDADVAWHALTDAILGALALGDIGDHFPPSDPQWKGAPSAIFLEAAAGMASAQGYAIAGLDITVICEAPKVKPHREAMRIATADCLGLPPERVSVKATTTEGLGFTGRREGIAAQAVATLVRASG